MSEAGKQQDRQASVQSARNMSASSLVGAGGDRDWEEQQKRYEERERLDRSIRLREASIAAALQVTTPLYTGSSMQSLGSSTPKVRTAEEVISAADKIAKFIESGAVAKPPPSLEDMARIMRDHMQTAPVVQP